MVKMILVNVVSWLWNALKFFWNIYLVWSDFFDQYLFGWLPFPFDLLIFIGLTLFMLYSIPYALGFIIGWAISGIFPNKYLSEEAADIGKQVAEELLHEGDST
jgi:hypothetical protein